MIFKTFIRLSGVNSVVSSVMTFQLGERGVVLHPDPKDPTDGIRIRIIRLQTFG